MQAAKGTGAAQLRQYWLAELCPEVDGRCKGATMYELWDVTGGRTPMLAGGADTVGECIAGAAMLLEVEPCLAFEVRDRAGEWYARMQLAADGECVDVTYNEQTIRIRRLTGWN